MLNSNWMKKKAVDNAIKEVKKLLDSINTIINDLNKQLAGKLTPKERQAVMDQLSRLVDIKNGLLTAYNPGDGTGSLANLQKYLGAITIKDPNKDPNLGDKDPNQPAGQSDKYFSVSVGPPFVTDPNNPNAWEDQLSSAEDAVKQGGTIPIDPADPSKGTESCVGLVELSSKVDDFQKTYSSQSTQMQMQLSFMMTQMNTWMSMITSAMSTLNDSILTILRGINPR